MSKYVFLGKLQIGLEKKLEEEEVRKIIEYYEGYIDEALDFGKSEEEVLQELGDVDELIAAILEGLKDYDVNIKDGEKSKGFNIELDEMLSEVTNFSKSITKEIGGVMKDVGDMINSTSSDIKDSFKKWQDEKSAAEAEAEAEAEEAEKLFEDEISDEALDEIEENVAEGLKEAIEEPEYSQSDVFYDSYQLNVNENPLDDLIIKATNLSVDVKLSDDGIFKAELINNEAKTCSFVAEYKENKLVLKQIRERIYTIVTINAPRLLITIPSIYKGMINVGCKNGKISIDGQGNKRSNKWEVSCKNGMVELRNIVMGDVRIECKNGKVDVLDSIIYRAKINCKNGMLTYRMLKNDFGKYINVRCKNGMIKTDDAQGFKGSYVKEITATKETKHVLSLVANCDNGIVRLSRFE